MRTVLANLNAVVVSSYDPTKTTVFGRAQQRTIGGVLVLGPPLTKAIDVFTDTAAGGSITPLLTTISPNGRIFVLNTISGGVGTIVLYSFNSTTGAFAHVGRIQFNMPNSAATTHTVRGFKVDDTGATHKIWLATTGSVAVNAGQFLINGLTDADFIPVGFPTIPMATSTGQKAVYFLQDPAALGNTHALTAAVGLTTPFPSADSSINKKCFTHNGVSATHQIYVFDGNVTPAVANTITGATITVATPGVVTATAHGYATGDQIVFTAGTLPTGLAIGTVYFVSSAGNTANAFQVSTTLANANAGTSITTTGSPGSGVTVMRAYGICSNLFSLKTGNLPAASGTLLATNSEYFANPNHGANATFDCHFFATTTNLYLGKYSELTSGVTTWPSLQSANILGTGSDVTAPTPAYAVWSSPCDMAVYATNTSSFIAKQMVNGVLKAQFGGLSTQYIEGNNPSTVQFGLTTVTSLDTRSGWLLIVGSTVGQRVVLLMDMRSDDQFNYSYVVSKILSTPFAIAKAISTYEQLFDYTDSLNFYYKTALNSNDPIFTDPTTGWTAIQTAKDLTAVALNQFTQLKIGFQVLTLQGNTPAQVNELLLDVLLNSETSDQWNPSADNTTPNGVSPAYTAFRLVKAYASVVPQLFFRAYDDSGNLVISANTVANPTLFEYSTNNGTSWNPLGTIPNTILTTEVRYKWASPPGVSVTSSLREI